MTNTLTERAMRRSILEGACYALMVGVGDLYIVANGIRLGAGSLEIGLLLALPLCLGALGPWFALRLMRAGRSRRRVAVVGAAGQALAYAAMAACELGDLLTPRMLIALSVLHQMSGQSTGIAWASWFGDVVPEGTRGHYFSRRNRVVHGATCLGAIVGGLILQWLEPANTTGSFVGQGGRGFIVLMSAAAVARLASMLLLARTHEPKAVPAGGPPVPIRRVFAESEAARRVLIVTVSMMVSVWIAAPYFAEYMLEDLRFSYLEYTIANVSVVVATVLILPAWGRAIDRKGPRGPYILATLGIALVPIPWFFANGLALVIPAQMLSGMCWGGHELAQFTSLLGGASSTDRARVFATINGASGVAQLSGTLIGAFLIGQGGFAMVLGATIFARLAVGILAAASLPSIAAQRRNVWLRLAGVRWTGGLRHRPIWNSSSDESDTPPP